MATTFGDNLGIAIAQTPGTTPWWADHEAGQALIDAVMHLDVITRSNNTPPGSPTNGDRHHTGNSPTGAWAGQANKIAVRRAAAWVFYTPKEGWLITCQADPGKLFKYESAVFVEVKQTTGDFKDSVRVATTANGALATAYENGDTVDGVVLATGDRILLKDQTAGAENGVYTVNATGAPTRAIDFDTSGEATSGCVVPVAEGTANGDTLFMLTTNDPIVLGTTALVFSAYGSGGGGSGTVNSGTAKQLAYYPATAAAVSGAAGYEYQAAASPNVKITAQDATYVALQVWSAATPSANVFEVSANNGTTVHFAITSTGAPTSQGAAGALSERFGAGSNAGTTSTDCLAVGGNAVITNGSDNATVIGSGSTGTNNDTLVGQAITSGGSSNTYVGAQTGGSGIGGVALGRASQTAAAHLVAGSATFPIADIYFGKGITSTTAAAVTIHGTGGSGLNNAGAVLNIAGGRSTGNVAGGSVVIQVAPLGASSSTLNALVTSAEFPSVGGVIMPEITAPATPAANSGHWFVKDVGGLSRPHFKGDDGTEFNLTTAGSGANTALSNLASVAINTALKGVDGTVSAPAYAFTSAANSGFFLASSAIQTAVGGGAVFAQYANGARVANNGRYEFSSDATPVGTADVLLSRFAANVLRVGGNAAGNTPGMLLVGPSTYSQTGALTTAFLTATTNAVVDAARISVFSSGTPSAGFGGRLSLTAHTTTTPDTLAAALDFSFPTATHASYKGRLTLWAKDSAGEREGLRIEASGSAPMLGVLGAAAVVRQTAGAATAGAVYTSTEQTMLQVVYDALRLFGFTT